MKWTWMEKELEKCLLAFEMIIDRNEKTDWESLPNEPRILILFSGGGFRFSRSSANCWEIHKKKKKKVESTSSMSSFFLGLLSPPSQCLIKPMRRDETCVSTLLLAFSLFLQQIRDSWPPTRRPFLFFLFLNPWPLYRAECGAHTTIETSVCCSLCATVIERRASCGITFDSCSWAQLIHWSTQILLGFIRVSIPALSKGIHTHTLLSNGNSERGSCYLSTSSSVSSFNCDVISFGKDVLNIWQSNFVNPQGCYLHNCICNMHVAGGGEKKRASSLEIYPPECWRRTISATCWWIQEARSLKKK